MVVDIDAVDWAALEAEDVPELLWALGAEDPRDRRFALDELEERIHYEGAVYDKTVACLPFLFELIADVVRADRGPVVELIVSIGRSGFGPNREAGSAIGERAEQFVPLLADADPEVRRGAAAGVASFLPDGTRAVGLLAERLAVEQDVPCRVSLIQAGADAAFRDPETADIAAAWLARMVDDDADPVIRLAALAHLTRAAPYYRDAEPAEEAVALLQAERDKLAEARTAELVWVLDDALGARITQRLPIVRELLRNPAPEPRIKALHLAGRMMDWWRGSYAELVLQIGELLAVSDEEVRDNAVQTLRHLGELAAPAADFLLAEVASGPRCDDPYQDPHNDMIKILGELGDERVLPALAAAVAQDAATFALAPMLEKFREHRAMFIPALREQLARQQMDPDNCHLDHLVTVVRRLGAVELLPEVEAALDLAVRTGLGRPVGSALQAFTEFGPAARTALPAIRELADRQKPKVWLTVIEALWAVERDIDTVLPLLRTDLANTPDTAGESAIEVAAAIGPAAAPLVDLIERRSAGDNVRLRAITAIALTRITGDFRAQEPQLRFAWHNRPLHRVDIAKLVRDLGPAAESFLPIVRAETTAAQRHTYVENGWSSDAVTRDEELLKLCAEIITGANGHS
ncbi:hypothetical protein ACWCXX_40955 [Streptomyces sp. NPDC001732]